MQRIAIFVLAVLGISAVPAVSQAPPGAERLRQQVMQRLLQTYQTQAGLTGEQEQRFRDVFQRSLRQRQDMQQREREIWQALEHQMRPGVAANADSVSKLMNAILASRAAMLEQAQNEQREFAAFLTPVQRAQLFIMWERFQRQLDDVRRRRMEMQQGGPPPGEGGPAPPPELGFPR